MWLCHCNPLDMDCSFTCINLLSCQEVAELVLRSWKHVSSCLRVDCRRLAASCAHRQQGTRSSVRWLTFRSSRCTAPSFPSRAPCCASPQLSRRSLSGAIRCMVRYRTLTASTFRCTMPLAAQLVRSFELRKEANVLTQTVLSAYSESEDDYGNRHSARVEAW
jgi:hypothetical protein